MTKKGFLTGIVSFTGPKGRDLHQAIPSLETKSRFRFEVISTASCIYCKRAKEKLTELGLQYRENVLNTREEKLSFKEAGHETVPQIYCNGEHIGGYDDLIVWLEKNSLG